MSINKQSTINNQQSTIRNQELIKFGRVVLIDRKSQPNKGAALLITMLIIASIGVMALAVARVVLSELKITTNYADSVIAYETAESGLERGLLEFRFNRNIEKDFPPVISSNNMAEYDLGISFRNPTGILTDELKKDESIDLYVGKIDPNDPDPFPIGIEWQGKINPNTGLRYKGWVEWRLLGGDRAEWGLAPPGNLPATDGCGYSGVSCLPISNTGFPNPEVLRIKFLSQEGNSINTAAIEYTITANNNPIDSGITTIESTGTVGKTQRKLVATIDRKSGTILGIFDYTIYAGVQGIEGL